MVEETESQLMLEIKGLKTCSDDLEKLEHMAQIGKLLKEDSVSAALKHEAFLAIGFDLVQKMIFMIADLDDADDEFAMYLKISAVSILTQYTTDEEMMKSHEIFIFLPFLCSIIKQSEAVEMVEDAYKCLSVILRSKKGVKAAGKCGIVKVLSTAYAKNAPKCEAAPSLLATLFSTDGAVLWEKYPRSINQFLTHLSQRIKDLRDQTVFEAFTASSIILHSMPPEVHLEGTPDFVGVFAQKVVECLHDKTILKHQDLLQPILSLSSGIIAHWGVQGWTGDQSEQSASDQWLASKDVALLVSTATVQVQLVLLDGLSQRGEVSDSSVGVLISCVEIIERCLMDMSAEDEEDEEDDEVDTDSPLLNLVKLCLEDVINFLEEEGEHVDKWTSKDPSILVSACIRLQAAWVNNLEVYKEEDARRVMPVYKNLCTSASALASGEVSLDDNNLILDTMVYVTRMLARITLLDPLFRRLVEEFDLLPSLTHLLCSLWPERSKDGKFSAIVSSVCAVCVNYTIGSEKQVPGAVRAVGDYVAEKLAGKATWSPDDQETLSLNLQLSHLVMSLYQASSNRPTNQRDFFDSVTQLLDTSCQLIRHSTGSDVVDAELELQITLVVTSLNNCSLQSSQVRDIVSKSEFLRRLKRNLNVGAMFADAVKKLVSTS